MNEMETVIAVGIILVAGSLVIAGFGNGVIDGEFDGRCSFRNFACVLLASSARFCYIREVKPSCLMLRRRFYVPVPI